MSWFKQFVVVSLAVVLSACGFTPIAGVPNAQGDKALTISALSIKAGSSEFAYNLRKYLSQRLVIDPNAAEALSINAQVSSENIAIQQNDTVTRLNLRALASYTLSNAETERNTQGKLESVTAVNATTDFFATRVSRREADQLLAADIGRKIITVLYTRRAVNQ